ncbi:ABC transporter ATP-binding protein [Mycolicibacterium sp. ELW1]|uniref:ABC transporter ATP-binding protein n=1 Tax=Mycobacteriaceae TaxID=1762 RepID=UPI002570AA9D|nr:ABC transporter ATP-binding protein [Mycobacterium sp. ELW1]
MSSPRRQPAAVALRGVGRVFGPRTVLRDITLDIAPGEMIALLGASGSGKSTLLRLVAGLDQPTNGRIEIDGKTVRGIDSRCAVVFQEPRLLPWRTLAGNVAYGLPAGTSRSDGQAAVQHWLEVVGLQGFESHRPRQVSGGMAQRAGLARALARRPGVLLLDEPLAALDALTRIQMQDLLGQVRQEAGATAVLVTHDVEEALVLADRVLVLRSDGSNGAGIAVAIDVTVPKPRDRTDPALAALRHRLLGELGLRGRGVSTDSHLQEALT